MCCMTFLVSLAVWSARACPRFLAMIFDKIIKFLKDRKYLLALYGMKPTLNQIVNY